MTAPQHPRRYSDLNLVHTAGHVFMFARCAFVLCAMLMLAVVLAFACGIAHIGAALGHVALARFGVDGRHAASIGSVAGFAAAFRVPMAAVGTRICHETLHFHIRPTRERDPTTPRSCTSSRRLPRHAGA